MKWGSPFDPRAEAIWVHATLEGTAGRSHDLILVVDTGTSETIVEQDIAELIGLDKSLDLGPAEYLGASGVQKGYYVPATSLMVGGRTVTEFRIASCHFDPDLETDGILGLDFLRQLRVLFDFVDGRVGLVDEQSVFVDVPVHLVDEIRNLIRQKQEERGTPV